MMEEDLFVLLNLHFAILDIKTTVEEMFVFL